jgi:hypothetical protein
MVVIARVSLVGDIWEIIFCWRYIQVKNEHFSYVIIGATLIGLLVGLWLR